MKNLSYWAFAHPWAARTIIVLAHLLLAWVGIQTGLALAPIGPPVPAVLLFGLAGIYLAAYRFYPSTRRFSSYMVRKTFDGMLVGSIALLWVGAGSRFPDRFEAMTIPATLRPSAQSMVQARPGDAASVFKK